MKKTVAIVIKGNIELDSGSEPFEDAIIYTRRQFMKAMELSGVTEIQIDLDAIASTT